MFLAVAAVMMLLLRDEKNTDEHDQQKQEREDGILAAHPDLILRRAAWVLVPFVFLFALYVLLNGEVSPGGGFSGGTILGAGLILYSAAYGPKRMRVLMDARRYAAVRTFGLVLYVVLYGIYIFLGANQMPNYLTGMTLLIDLAVGLVVACIGMDPMQGQARFTFGNHFPYSGTCTIQRSQVRIMVMIHRGRNCHNIKVAITNVFNVSRALEAIGNGRL